MSKKIIIAVSVLILILGIALFSTDTKEGMEIVEIKAERGDLEVVVKTSGEFRAETSKKIDAPAEMRKLHIYNVRVTDLIPEGTIVKKGQYIGTLDKSELNQKLQETQDRIAEYENRIKNLKIDTTIQLKNMRDKIVDMEYKVKEAEVKVKQSIYEPPISQRKAEIALQTSKRNIDQTRRSYKIKKLNAETKLRNTERRLEKYLKQSNEYQKLINKFTIKAPESGMLIYYRTSWGRIRKIGDYISPWNPTIAMLPDLNSLVLHTFINETDISKIKKGLKVDIEVEAFPDKKFEGKIKKIANIGEIQAGTNNKVFEIIVSVNAKGADLRPGMTTTNKIITALYKEVIYVPLEAVRNQGSLTYVILSGFYKKRQEVKPGAANDNYIIIEEGLEGGEKILLTPPENEHKLPINKLKMKN